MPNPRDHLPDVVIGGGVSGLTAAYRLAQAGERVILLDRRESPGGRVYSERRDGFLVEHGPNSMISPAPGAETLIDTLGLRASRIDKGDRVRRRYLVREGSAHALPIDPLGFFTSNFFTLRGRLRLLCEPFVSRHAGDESIADFIRRRFGQELLDYVFDPLVGGLYAGNPENLSIAALLPRLKQLESRYGSVVGGAVRKMLAGIDPRYDPRRRQLFSFRDGMTTLPARMAQALGGRLRSGVRVEELRPVHHGNFRLRLRTPHGVENLLARRVVIALPAYAAARLIETLSPEAAQELAGIAHPPLAVVGLGYRREDIDHPLDGLGVLTPTIEQRKVLGCLFSSTLFAGRAPAGHALLTAYVGGARQPALARLPREDLIALVQGEARDLLGCRGGPVFSSVRYWAQGLPQPDMHHARRLKVLGDFQQDHPHLTMAGNYHSGVSTGNCIDVANLAVDRLLEKSALTGRQLSTTTAQDPVARIGR